MIINDQGMDNLTNAIVAQAAKDYEDALRCDDESMIRECERFFRSRWYRMLTTVDGEYLISELQKKATEPLDETNQIQIGAR